MILVGPGTTTDKRPSVVCRFMGEAYEAAGGSVRRDLFDPKGGGFVQDAALLDRLTYEQLQAIAETVKEEGWKWALSN